MCMFHSTSAAISGSVGYCSSFIFCSAKLRMDEQEITRCLLLSPETTNEKIKKGISEVLRRETDGEQYNQQLENHPSRRLLLVISLSNDTYMEVFRISDPKYIHKLFC